MGKKKRKDWVTVEIIKKYVIFSVLSTIDISECTMTPRDIMTDTIKEKDYHEIQLNLITIF
jgi:hypothetical protein